MQSISEQSTVGQEEFSEALQWGTWRNLLEPDSKLAPGCAGGRGHRVARRGKSERQAVLDAQWDTAMARQDAALIDDGGTSK